MSSFFNNFMGGLAFGIMASNPFFRGMGGFGYGCGCGYGGVGGFLFGGMYNAVNLTGFANPFPSIFGGCMGGGYASSAGLIMPTTFANAQFPTVDFSGPCQTIWDTFTNPDSDYNKQMRDWFEKINNQQNSQLSAGDKSDKDNKAKDVQKAKGSENASDESDKPEISYDAKKLKDKWASKAKTFDDKCYAKVIEISKKIKCNPNDLMAIMNLESTGFKLGAINPKSGATGLIQFMPATAQGLGTTVEALAKMSAFEQLDYVEECLVASKKIAKYSDDYQLKGEELYAIVFRPKYAQNAVLASQGEKAYKDNKILDVNNDKTITKEDLHTVLQDYMA